MLLEGLAGTPMAALLGQAEQPILEMVLGAHKALLEQLWLAAQAAQES